jgi:VWFA-related protein
MLSLAPLMAPGALLAQTATPQREMTEHEVEPTYKLHTERNLVTVRAIVRDAKGAVVDNLRKEDFQVFDHGKPQTILNFSLEKPAQKAAEAATAKPFEEAASETESTGQSAPAGTARRFVALYFDDVNTTFENLARARDAADHIFAGSIQPGDRVALFTSSGQKQVDFTADFTQVRKALFELRPRPIVPETDSCATVPPYQAYLIVDRNDPNAIAVATDEVMNCDPCPAQTPQQLQQCLELAQTKAQELAMQSLSFSETQSTAALRGIESIVRHMGTLPGQRSMVIISAGFLTETLLSQIDGITDRALRAGVIVSAVDARGLYSDVVTDINQRAHTNNARLYGMKLEMLRESAQREAEGMRSIALDSGGIFFENSNDLEAGFRRASVIPEAYYVLTFSPPNLKLDGSYHSIQVKLAALKGYSVQARRGYFAPHKPADPKEEANEDIREALFSQDETHELPIDIHTQFFMTTQSDARLSVLTRIDLHPLHFRKEGDRNFDNLSFVTAVFDQDGHTVSIKEKIVEFQMHDNVLARFVQSGITMKTLFDVKPGTYMVRAVVRDSESGQISGMNRTVEIPLQ